MGDFIQTNPNEFVGKKKEDGHLAATRPPRHVTDLVSSTKVYLAKPVSTYHYIYLSNERANIGACKIHCFYGENKRGIKPTREVHPFGAKFIPPLKPAHL